MWEFMAPLIAVVSLFFPGDKPVEEWTHLLVIWLVVGILLKQGETEC
jgi:hypothetical protein